MCLKGLDTRMKEDHPESPNNSENGSYMGNPGDNHMENNGYHHHHHHGGSAIENGSGSNGSLSGDSDNSRDSHYDEAPLDFSMKKSAKHLTNNYSGSENSSDIENHPISNGIDAIASSLAQNVISKQLHVTIKQEAGLEKVGEPQVALPGILPPGFPLPPGLLPLPNMNMGLLHAYQEELSKASRANEDNDKTRPFKAFPKDPLAMPLGFFGLPGGMLPLPNVDLAAMQALNMNSEELYKRYEEYMCKLKEQGEDAVMQVKNQIRRTQSNHDSPPNNLRPPQHDKDSRVNSSPEELAMYGSPLTPPFTTPKTSPVVSHHLKNSLKGDQNSPRQPHSSSRGNTRKRPRTLPENEKDEAYWERRRKNNEAAKRSRDSRRAKEDEIAIRAAFLEQENLKLRVELAALKNETAKLKCMLYSS